MKSFSLLIVCFILFLVIYLPISLWTWRSLDFWVDYAKGFNYDTPYLPAALLTLLGPITFTANVVTEVARMFF